MGLFSGLFGSKNNNQLSAVLNNSPFLVDVRTPGEYASGSVTGAVNIPLDKIQEAIGRFKGKNNIVVFCRSGNRSGQAKSILEQHGIQGVTNGGTWQQVNKALQS